MNPPPPILPALGCVTASAKAVATAASTAFPPFARIAAPTSEAGAETETTMPVFEETAGASFCANRDAVSCCAGSAEAMSRPTMDTASGRERFGFMTRLVRGEQGSLLYDTHWQASPLLSRGRAEGPNPG